MEFMPFVPHIRWCWRLQSATPVQNQTPLLIEATSNQVDQFGGYTGMTPADFRGFVCQLADSLNFPQDALILGGDHLGPNRWQNLPAAQAMANADDLIKATLRQDSKNPP